MSGFNMKVTPEIERLTEVCKEHSSLDLSLYGKYDVKRGLRDINGKGCSCRADPGFQCAGNKDRRRGEGNFPFAGKFSLQKGYDIKELTGGFIRVQAFRI